MTDQELLHLTVLAEKLEDVLLRVAHLEECLAKKKAGAFAKPTVDEVATYCLSRKNQVNALAFFDFYESVGWKIGTKPMKNWQAAVRTWEQKDRKAGAGQTIVTTLPIAVVETPEQKRARLHRSIVAKEGDAAMARYLKEVGGT